MIEINREKLEAILKNVQTGKSVHQKNVKILEQVYREVNHQDFIDVLFKYLKYSVFPTRNEFVERILHFLAQFVAFMTPVEESLELEEDRPSHPFLTEIIVKTLEYHNVIYEAVRFNSCLFIKLILQNIGYQTHLDNDVCDLIQQAMLERTMDLKPAIRHQAVMALVRLQDPLNPDCPVIKEYLSLIVDPNPSIRNEVVKSIAPYSHTIPHITSRLRDVDMNVRIMALRRCADLGPKHFRIVERQFILRCGLREDQERVKKVFVDNLLMKWLHAYSGNFIDFLYALRLDADENDIINTEEISKDILNLMFRSVSMNEVISGLPLENKLIPLEKLSSEVVTLWNITVNYMKQSEDMEDYLELVLPELTPFCDYVESVINSRHQASAMEEWQYLDYQYVLHALFEIVEQHDFADEVGRKRLNTLVVSLLKTENTQFRLKKKLISIADRLKSGTQDFITEVCHIISEIREPMVEKPMESTEAPSSDFQVAQLRVKLDVLKADLEEATDLQEFLKANALKQEIDKLEEQLKELSAPEPAIEVVKITRDDPKTICCCLDILIALLQLPSVDRLYPSLVTVKDEFVVPSLKSIVTEINWRVLNCLSLFCVLDDGIAEEYIKILSIPIITYRAIPNFSKLALITSVKVVTDLFCLYGMKIYENLNDAIASTSSLSSTKRRLYRNDDDESIIDPNRYHFESVVEIVLDMLDDENCEIRECSVIAISKLILSNFPVTPPLITRIILKWYNPLTVKASDNLQQVLGILIGNFASTVPGAREVISKAVVPILTSIANAPKTSPLADVDIDNLLQFLAAITNSGNNTNVNIHLNLANILCYEIIKKNESSVTQYFAKILLYLELESDNAGAVKELIAQVNIILSEEIDLDKAPRRNVMKFLEKLNNILNTDSQIRETRLETVYEVEEENRGQEQNSDEDPVPETVDSTKNNAEEIREQNSISTNDRLSMDNIVSKAKGKGERRNNPEEEGESHEKIQEREKLVKDKSRQNGKMEDKNKQNSRKRLRNRKSSNDESSPDNENAQLEPAMNGTRDTGMKRSRKRRKHAGKQDSDSGASKTKEKNDGEEKANQGSKRNRGYRNHDSETDIISSTDSELEKENKKRRKVNVDERLNNKRKNKTPEKGHSPKRKMKKVTSETTRAILLKTAVNNNHHSKRQISDSTIDNNMIPVAESTRMTRSSFANKLTPPITFPRKNCSLERRSTRSSHSSQDFNTSKESLLHTILEEISEMSRLSTSSISNKSSVSERSLRSRVSSLSRSSSGDSPRQRKSRNASKTELLPTPKSKRK